jgi:serine/threonine protein kinase/ABC-type branched-subunit amino acid transport system substrate-binding protein
MEDRIGQQFGNYDLTRLLGSGGFADVYLGKHHHLERQAAIKVLNMQLANMEEKASFKKEACIIARLDHKNIVRIYDYGFQDQTPYLVMEYSPNGTLRTRHPKGTRLPLEQIVQYLKQIAPALDYAHQQRVIHRDVKPENILLTANDEVVLSDFGIAVVQPSLDSLSTQGQAGTPVYMAPEQIDGHPCAASDQYAVGVLVYEWLSGDHPFHGSLSEIVGQHLFALPPSLCEKVPTISPKVDQVVRQALAKKPEERFASITEFALELKQACTDIGKEPIGKEPELISPPIHSTTTRFDPKAVNKSSSADHVISDSGLPGKHGVPYAFLSFLRRRLKINKAWRIFLIFLLALVFITSTVAVYIRQSPIQSPKCGPAGITSGECTGLSDGAFAFDTDRADGNLKMDAAKALKAGNIGAAQAYWKLAIAEDRTDAEAQIYQENQLVKGSGSSYITFVVATSLTGDPYSMEIGRDTLQGADVAQQECNKKHTLPCGRQVRLLVANIGDPSLDAMSVAQQIVQAKETDSTIVGVVGWPFGSDSNAIKYLAANGIPMVSPAASSDAPSGISPFYFSVAPSLNSEASAGARFAEQVLHVTKAALFYDPNDSYSNNLAEDFWQQFEADGNTILPNEYTVGHPEALNGIVHSILSGNPDLKLIYFAGYPNDVSTLIEDLQNLPSSSPQVMGGDALYRLGGYDSSVFQSFHNFYFTAAAYPDEWEALHRAQTPFFPDYAGYFNPHGQHLSGYSYTRPDSGVMLSYDAMLTLFDASSNLPPRSFTGDDLKHALMKISGPFALQGISGRISFAPTGIPEDKAVVVLQVNGGLIRLAGSPQQWLWGKFFCDNPVTAGVSCQ